MPPLRRFQQNGSLVVAKTEADVKVLHELIARGDLNGVRNLRIVDREELREMEPHIHPDAIAALYSPDAGTITPYEYTIALAENAVDNGVELRLRREVTSVDVMHEQGRGGEVEGEVGEGGGKKGGGRFRITVAHWEPEKTARRLNKEARGGMSSRFVRVLLSALTLVLALCASTAAPLYRKHLLGGAALVAVLLCGVGDVLGGTQGGTRGGKKEGKKSASARGEAEKEEASEGMYEPWSYTPSSGTKMEGLAKKETIFADYIINAAGCSSDKVARMVGDDSFTVKPRMGEYILLHKDEVKDAAGEIGEG